MSESYDELVRLLRIWRFAPSEDPRVQGEAGNELADRMAVLKRELGNEEWTRASKQVGWER
jgi:hypothetical protein